MRRVRHISPRLLLLGFGLGVVSAGVVVLASVSNASVVVATRELRRYSTSTYDILVRPAGARSPVEESHGLVEPNHLSGIAGGIGFGQYEAIRGIPGVEVAAPIAMLGYVSGFVDSDNIITLSEPGWYILQEEMVVRDGARVYGGPNFTRWTFHYFGPEPDPTTLVPGDVFVNQPGPLRGFFDFPFLLAGIEPGEEAALVRLDEAVVEGRYLMRNEPLNRRGNPFRQGIEAPVALVDVPVLVNETSYIDVTLHASVKKVAASVDDAEMIAALERRDWEELARLPTVTLAERDTSGAEAYTGLIEALTSERGLGWIGSSPLTVPAPIEYREAELDVDFAGITLQVVPAGGDAYWGYLSYRTFAPPTGETDFDSAFNLVAKGVIDIERVPRPEEIVALPLETYFPPTAALRYDVRGHPLVGPLQLRPTLNPAGYIQSPPLMLTTLEAARALRGEDAISAIRVRVGGIDELTPANQRKIEAVASSIEQLTGLTVDIMTGSSPTRVLVHVPEIGYVEELWIQKGANLVYQERIQAGNWLLLAVLLAVAGVFTLDLTWADVFDRQRTIAVQKALGWRSGIVLRSVVERLLVVCGIASLLGTLAGTGLVLLGGWLLPSAEILAGVPPVVTLVAVLGGLYPALQAARLPPIIVIQSAGVSHKVTQLVKSRRGPWGYALQGLLRRLRRSVLATLMAAASGGLLVVMGGVLVGREGMLGATLLGEFILVRIGPMHFAIVLAGLALTILSAGNALHARVVEQTREIGTLKALGWRRIDVGRLFVRQGLLIGAMGGLVGTVVGLAAYVLLNRDLPPMVAVVGILSVCIVSLVGMLSSLYPAALAARVPPAVALRHK